jgi:putative ATPase
MSLFDYNNTENRPLAERMRPASLDEFIGQYHLTGKESLLRNAIDQDKLFSMLLWGPPGCGKTTLAGIIAKTTQAEFIRISAVMSGVKDIREIIKNAQERRRLHKKRTLLFIDEIHRFNKAQQDAFLHHVETGIITLVGATTENPSFEIIPALVSRCRVFTLKSLEKKDILQILKRAVTDAEKGLGLTLHTFTEEALIHIADISDGDARVALTNLETASIYFNGKTTITEQDIQTALKKKSLLYDKAGEEHYNLISAFIKSLRGSDPDAAIYWLERMLSAGDDPYYLIRRMIRFATEDIGMADPGALTMALNANAAYRILGSPEGDDAIFQASIYLATAPKSNSVYKAHIKVKNTIEQTGYFPVPLHIRNAPTRLMKELNYGEGYKYAHDYPEAFVAQSYLPDELNGRQFYFPDDRGYEKTVKQRLEAWVKLRTNINR